MKDSWESGDAYDGYMGRWSRRVAEGFVAWLPGPSGRDWLDVGCGSGALGEAVIGTHAPAALVAVDRSTAFLDAVRRRLADGDCRVDCRAGDATALPLDDDSVDVTVSGLMLNFVGERAAAVSEMQRVTRSGGLVAAYVWDYAGSMDMLRHFWDAAAGQDPAAVPLHEATRFADIGAAALESLFRAAGLCDVVSAPIDIATPFRDFDDYWQPMLGGQGPAPSYLVSLDAAQRHALRDALRRRLPFAPDGSIPMAARAWAVRGGVRK